MSSTPILIHPLSEAPGSAREVSGTRSRTRQDLFTEWSAGLAFPAHFGRNWDAFTDCLRDIVPVAVIVRDAADLLADAPPHELAVLLDVLAESGGVRLFLDDTPDRLASLNTRLSTTS
ncbi:barstar family protein [Streptomyces roseirectus]|uniref:Barstar family protein n=1 Tax=Streptomyces roseirectus TaxID=2768066 RepID=A0A7H0IEI6_9ACTN|nr:barstar family protein [Streptomyces roseirectus]QNP71202.1 barstar family protein [Streptomyces roseirectus]